VAALREQPRFATTRFRVLDLDDAAETLKERGEAQRRCGRKAAELFIGFLEGEKAQGAFDFGDAQNSPHQ
jgi:hypothetical protein